MSSCSLRNPGPSNKKKRKGNKTTERIGGSRCSSLRANTERHSSFVKGRTTEKSMIKHIFALAVIGVIAGTLLTGCEKTSEQQVDNAKQKVGEAKQQLKDARTEYLAEWQTFKRESEQTIEANEKRIDAFREKMEKAGPKVKAKYSKEVAALERKNRGMKEKLEEYKDEGEGKWEEFKTNFK